MVEEKPVEETVVEEKKEETKNEFEDLEGDFPEQTTADVPGESSDMIAQGSAGVVYDYKNAPDSVRAPDRVNLDGKTVTILKADLILPNKNVPWEKTRDKSKECKFCIFKLYYDIDSQQEFYSGVRVFKNNPDSELYSHPSIAKNGLSQSSALLVAYATYKKMEPKDVSLREFLSFLNGKPKAVIQGKEFENPEDKTKVVKNMVVKFID